MSIDTTRQEMELDLLSLFRIIWRRRILICALVFGASVLGYIGSKLSAKIYEAASRIMVIDAKSSGLSILNEISGMPKNQVANYVEILKSRSLMLDVAADRNLPTDQKSMEEYRASLTVQPVQGTDLIEIRFQSKDRRQAQEIANAYVRCFLARSLRDNQEDARNARQFIEEQLTTVGDRLLRSEAALAGYQKDSRVVSASDETRQAVEKLAQLEASKATMNISLAQARARLEKVQEQLSTEEQNLVSGQVLARNPLYEKYRQELSDLNTKLAADLAQYTENHPEVIALRAQIDKLQEELNKEMEMNVQSQTESLNPVHTALLQDALRQQAEIMAAQAGLSAIDREIGNLDARLAGLPDKEMQLARLMRDKASSEAIYNLLVTKKSEMEITEKMRTPDVRLVDPAYLPEKDMPVKPKTKLNVAIAFCLGLFAGIGLAFLLEYMDPSIKTREEAEAALGLPVFGLIPNDETFRDDKGAKQKNHGRRKGPALPWRVGK